MSTCILWFRKSLRLHDNAPLIAAAQDDGINSILPLYILDPEQVGKNFEKFGPNRLKFLIDSLRDLNDQLSSNYKSKLIILNDNPLEIFDCIQQNAKNSINSLFCEFSSEPWERKAFSDVSNLLKYKNPAFIVNTFSAVHTILDLEKTISLPGFRKPKSMKDMEKIFSANFETNNHGFFEINEPLMAPKTIHPLPDLTNLGLNGSNPKLSVLSVDELADKISLKIGTNLMSVKSYFTGGETEALQRLEKKVSGKTEFVNTFRKPKTMSTNSDGQPLEPSTTGLSPYISFGNLSPRKLWKECEKCQLEGHHSKPPESLHGQMMFREMFYLLSLTVDNWDKDISNEMCKNIQWSDYDKQKMDAWENGQTGFPLIDAMMRQLSATGWMHHLGRHAVSCFLTRGQLWQNWKFGRDVFDRKLLDSDWALNNGNWLWLAGVAPFSMPYFRLYNPCPDPKSSLNVESKTAEFIRHWVPELNNFPVKYIYEPHLAPISIQTDSNCIIGTDYPSPIVDRKECAKQNLASFKASLAKKK
jgi:cryptochrome